MVRASIQRLLLCLPWLLAASADATEISFWSWRVEDRAFYEAVAREHEARTGVKVRFHAFKNTDYPTVLSAALAAGAGPDVAQVRGYGALAALADGGHLLPLNASQVPALATFPPAMLAAARGRTPPHDGLIYGLPFATQALGVFVNRALLQQAGVGTLPATWAELLATCQALKAKRLPCLANGSKDATGLEQLFGVVGPLFYGGTPFFDGVLAGRRRFTEPGFVRALQEVAALKTYMHPNHLGVGENESRTLFASGLAAFYVAGIWNLETLRKLNPQLAIHFMALPPLRAGELAPVSTFVDGNYALNAHTPQPVAALQFLNHLASREFGERFTRELGQLSALPGVQPSDPLLQQVAQQQARQGTPFLMLVGFRYRNPNGSVLLREGLQKLIQNRTTADQLAQDIQTGLASWHHFD